MLYSNHNPNYRMHHRVRSQTLQGNQCGGNVHVVKKGDTLYKISRLHGVSVDALMNENPDVNVYNLQVGEQICIPNTSNSVRQMSRTNVNAQNNSNNKNEQPTHQTSADETFKSIAEQYNIDIGVLFKANPHLMDMMLPPNVIISIPNKKMPR